MAAISEEEPILGIIGFSIMWIMWKARNNWVFKRKEIAPLEILANAQRISCHELKLTSTVQANSGKDCELDLDGTNSKEWDVSCWVDASWQGSHVGGAGIFINEYPSTFILGRAVPLQQCESALVGEALALLEDSSQYDELRQLRAWAVEPIIHDCKNVLANLDFVKICFTSRCNNSMAHSLARLAVTLGTNYKWTDPALIPECSHDYQ
ncbi:uncharacterized protein [Typha latifolia]|uniref:uncharacterized protein n=1 Tax=Typha latifolia TaxID=4733 RepID=UPI003C2F2FFD